MVLLLPSITLVHLLWSRPKYWARPRRWISHHSVTWEVPWSLRTEPKFLPRGGTLCYLDGKACGLNRMEFRRGYSKVPVGYICVPLRSSSASMDLLISSMVQLKYAAVLAVLPLYQIGSRLISMFIFFVKWIVKWWKDAPASTICGHLHFFRRIGMTWGSKLLEAMSVSGNSAQKGLFLVQGHKFHIEDSGWYILTSLLL